MNHIVVAGHIGNDPESRYTSSGQKVTSFRIATNSKRSGKEETIWWKITIWGDQFDKMLTYLKKGSSIIVMGELSKPEIYNDREGNPQISLNITASSLSFSPFGRSDRSDDAQRAPMQKQENSFGGSGQGGNQGGSSDQEAYKQMMNPEGSAGTTFADDEIPF